jgi:hypothetical protein
MNIFSIIKINIFPLLRVIDFPFDIYDEITKKLFTFESKHYAMHNIYLLV